MDENNLHNFSKKLFESYRIEKLPDDFTKKLMVRIEHEKIAEKHTKPLFSRKFFFLFAFTFLSIFAIGFYFQDKTPENGTTPKIVEKIKLPDYDFEKILKLFDFELEISLFVKLIIISIIVLVAIDLLTGSILDYFIDSRTKKESR